ncbi:Ubiquinone/menaquinone biosynthesis C-methylase UbiE [Mycobacterium numidiamassiliense]|uniref:Ubiquinone/menaquinone biosynthesis C-methylase UbiE n=1 Tax=Mycobacterium numidiamassiliense TaxID=1841861 RepID=A0A2U3PC19_9MYCO|nr:Ubiquinone/menaquinone biosynthesis C-methylase UbiE [Mycobacterium numidiamassiliense]
MTQAAVRSVDHPFFARVWPVAVNHEAPVIRALRQENLVGLSGRVLEVGAGIGTNFPLYPDSVEQVIAIEPEPRLAARARAAAAVTPVPIQVIDATVEEFGTGAQFDAVVCSLVLCSVSDPDGVLRQLMSVLLPGGQLRYLEHVASTGARGRLQRFADATVWPKFLGNCHTHRDTERSIVDAGFEVDNSRREFTLPFLTIRPVVSELALGRARKPLAGVGFTSAGRAAVAAGRAAPGSPARGY